MNELLVVFLTLGFALLQGIAGILCLILWYCFYVSFERSLRLVMPDEC